MSDATERAAMPKGTHAAMENRTVFNANRNLLSIIKPGDKVLDVGCGSGSVTASLAALVGEEGTVTGIDTSEHLIEIARAQYKHIGNVHFEIADILNYQPAKKIDVASAARVLQWVANPASIIKEMAALLTTDGYLSVLDYNHEKIQWSPAPPESMQQFYKAFLQWRKDAGMDNAIGDHLAGIFNTAGLKNIAVTNQHEISNKEDEDFMSRLNIWAVVADTRGHQLVKDGYIRENLRVQAAEEYRLWTGTKARSMQLYLLAVTGRQ